MLSVFFVSPNLLSEFAGTPIPWLLGGYFSVFAIQSNQLSYRQDGAPDRIRTCDLCLRSYMSIGYLFDFIEVLVDQTP